ncbi:MAG TPA: type II toxin-antitoxin system YhaV family toxin [Stellaceae bacterium]|nr:type II toxin-antitoxin system YhaV family toxin [Stellaceae bacterium]
MVVNGWTLLFHSCMTEQVRVMADPALKALKADPAGAPENMHVKMLAAVAKLVLEVIPQDPSRREYRQGDTLGDEYKHWFRAKFFQRFRLFFRYQTKSKVIVFAWVNDLGTQRQSGGRNDPYAVFRAMLQRKNPPDDWNELVRTSASIPPDLASALQGAAGKRWPESG